MAKKKEPQKFRLHYYLRNNGDGSASACFTKTEAEAEKADEELEEGWGEPCASYVELAVIDGKIRRRELVWDGKKHNEVWVPLEEVK